MSKQNDNKLLELDFDQYGRYQIILDTISADAKRRGLSKYTILDVGGYKGSTRMAFSGEPAKITIIDLFDTDEPEYIKTDTVVLPFSDGSFDYVVSLEVLEHVKREDRKEFLSEISRVAKNFFMISVPVAGVNDESAKAEIALNELFKTVQGRDHPWLIEHIDFKTPSKSEIDKLLGDCSIKFKSIGNNNLMMWNIMMSDIFMRSFYGLTSNDTEIQSAYNKISRLIDEQGPHYRQIYVGSNNKEALPDLDPKESGSSQIRENEITRLLLMLNKKQLKTIGKVFKDSLTNLHDANTALISEQRENARLNQEKNSISTELELVRKELELIKNSRSWKALTRAQRVRKSLSYKGKK